MKGFDLDFIFAITPDLASHKDYQENQTTFIAGLKTLWLSSTDPQISART